MSGARLIAMMSILTVGLAPGPGQSQEPRTAQPPTTVQSQSQIAAPAAAPLYKPPLRGAPGGRIGGGTRGTGGDKIALSVLAPDHSGLTISEQPSLYWFISTATSLPVEVAVMDPRAVEPLLEARLTGPTQAGAQRIDLARYGIRLAPGVPYRWYVAVVPDPARRSKDILAGGTIERVAPPAELGAKLAAASQQQLPLLYAEAGFWYDSLAAFSALIEAAPSDEGLLRQRAALLAQIGLGPEGQDARSR
jgi:hypothetical protein